MMSSRSVVAAFGIACVAAAGGGAYLASRRPAAQDLAAAAESPATAAASRPDAGGPQAVQETEAVVAGPPLAPRVEKLNRPRSASVQPGTPGQAPTGRQPARVELVSVRTEPPPLERSWPTGAGGPGSTPVVPPVELQVPTTSEVAPVEPPRAPEPPPRLFEELVVSAESVIGLQLDSAISSERAQVEDRVEARVVRDVRVGGNVAVPAGARAFGSVTFVERGGKFKERARLGIRFNTLVLSDGTELAISTETITRFGDAPGNRTTAKIGGGAVAGAILGAIVGGAKGAAIGATSGAGAGTAAVVAGDRSAAVFPQGTEVTARILAPIAVTIEK